MTLQVKVICEGAGHASLPIVCDKAGVEVSVLVSLASKEHGKLMVTIGRMNSSLWTAREEKKMMSQSDAIG